MHSVFLLHLGLPQPLVERRAFSGPGHPAAGLPLAGRQPRRGHRRASGRAGRPVQGVSLPHHPQLHPHLPQGPGAGHRYRQNQADAVFAQDLKPAEAAMTNKVRIARIYDRPDTGKAARVLVDRVWPRGISKDDAALDHWMKEVAPTAELRKWFGHDPKLWAAFRQKYEKELRDNDAQKECLDELVKLARSKPLALLYGAKDREHNQAVVLCGVIDRRLNGDDRARSAAAPLPISRASSRRRPPPFGRTAPRFATRQSASRHRCCIQGAGQTALPCRAGWW